MNVGSKETLGQTQNHPSGKWEINDSHKIHKDDGVFSIYYKKNHNLELFNSLENSELQLHNIQNYIPIYENFFLLTETNNNSINLNQHYNVTKLKSVDDNNNITAFISDEKNNSNKKEIFLKFSPLIDPVKYLCGKYDNDEHILNIPSFNSLLHNSNIKTLDKNNSAYVDGFFSYLSSQTLHNHDFIHGLDFYGAYLANKEDFAYNIYDDIECLEKSNFFLKNKDILYTIDDKYDGLMYNGTRSNKIKLNISNDVELQTDILEFDNFDMPISNNIIDLSSMTNNENNIEVSAFPDLSFNTQSNNNKSTDCEKSTDYEKKDLENDDDDENDDSYSSRSSYTYNSNDSNRNMLSEDDETIEDNKEKEIMYKKHRGEICSPILNDEDSDSDAASNNNDDTDNDTDGSYFSEDDETLIAKIKNFPVEIIMLEKCENTLDYLMMDAEEELTSEEWISALMQIIMTLISYQKMFSFTHNDLHTNNVMFITTEKEYLYYCYNKIYYKVPTYGRIFKIIDFGRSIYKYKGVTICSDSFSMTGDAATQYNCDPYFNDKKPRLEPNFSFDLCRLACSLFDYFIEDINDIPNLCKEDPLTKLIVDWVTDDKNRNILYKTNGEERYPDFKLYKMIARNVHNHTPQVQLNNTLFKNYETTHKKIKKGAKIINIDKLPCYTN